MNWNCDVNPDQGRIKECVGAGNLHGSAGSLSQSESRNTEYASTHDPGLKVH